MALKGWALQAGHGAQGREKGATGIQIEEQAE